MQIVALLFFIASDLYSVAILFATVVGIRLHAENLPTLMPVVLRPPIGGLIMFFTSLLLSFVSYFLVL